MVVHGYNGKILRVNLSDKSFKEEPISDSDARKYMGGSILGAKLLLEKVTGETDPLSAENLLIFGTGPLCLNFAASSRYAVVAKSPLTGIWGEASSGGRFGHLSKKAGFDMMVFEGISEKPVYLWVNDGSYELRDASSVWGKDSIETVSLLQKETHPKASVACIGPAGERLAKLASVMNDNARAAGRCGLGAVMGSKKLKAIACFGTKQFKPLHPEKLPYILRQLRALPGDMTTIGMNEFGTAMMLDMFWPVGDIPVKNWNLGIWEEEGVPANEMYARIGGARMRKTIYKKQYACLGCPVGCGRVIKIESGPYQMEGPGPEYETLASFGTLCLNDNLESICKANDLCNRYGLDTISVGSTVAWAIEAYEKGIITKDDVGFELKWGDAEAIVKLTEMIAKGEGIGKLLSDGTVAAATELGKGIELAVHVKGLEIAMHDPRAFHSMAIQYATANRGGAHVEGWSMMGEVGFIPAEFGIEFAPGRFETRQKGFLASKIQDFTTLVNAATVCMFVALPFSPSMLAQIFNAVTGWDLTGKELMTIGTRGFNLKRVFNVRCGIRKKDDTLPPKVLKAATEGGHAGHVPNLDKMREEYYQVRRWSEDGIPTKELLLDLDLPELAKELWG
ncbi:MAG: aldehyde ferredoxin oxidoreductase family protein [Candidatus Helarchaeota archaeon]|nr:aldehyde ferredoxin oxidoreductase family protein [Candidatus Helarchaeota archaeon]